MKVLEHMGRGLTNQEIAEALCISSNTLEHHITKIYAKLGVRERSQAVIYAFRRRLIELPDPSR